MNEYEQLDTLLSNADWYYMRSDSDSTYQRGLKDMERLIQMKLALPDQEIADKIWSNHSPFTNNKTK
jgi:hypothetical protein